MVQVGVIFPPWFPPERLRSTALAAEEAGVDQLWLWEDCFFESGLAAAAAALAWTERLQVGIGLLPVPLRNVAIEAMEIATLDRLFPGRLIPVVGHGVQSWMGQVGARAQAPLTLLREHIMALDALLAGEEVTTSGRYVTLDDVRLAWPPSSPLRVWGGSSGERTLAMLGEVAGGVLLDSSTSPARVAEVVELLRSAGEAVGRPSLPEIAVYVHCSRGPADDEPARLSGDAAQVAEGIARFAAAGAGTVVLRPAEGEPDLEGLVRWIGAEVLPLLR